MEVPAGQVVSLVWGRDFSGTRRCKFNSILWNLPFTSQSLRDQLTVALENGKQVKEELQKLKEEIRAERASVQAARVIEKQKRELGIKRQVDMFNQSQEAVNQRVDSLISTMGQHSTVEVVINGVKHGETTNEYFYMFCAMVPQLNYILGHQCSAGERSGWPLDHGELAAVVPFMKKLLIAPLGFWPRKPEEAS